VIFSVAVEKNGAGDLSKAVAEELADKIKKELASNRK
jgi:hypothetical protein